MPPPASVPLAKRRDDQRLAGVQLAEAKPAVAQQRRHIGAIAHLMHAVWGYSVCCCHAQNAGFIPIPSEVDPSVQPMLSPFVVMTFTLGSLSAAAAYLSFTAKPKTA